MLDLLYCNLIFKNFLSKLSVFLVLPFNLKTFIIIRYIRIKNKCVNFVAFNCRTSISIHAQYSPSFLKNIKYLYNFGYSDSIIVAL